MNKIFINENALKEYINKCKEQEQNCKAIIRKNKNELLQLNNEFCFIFENYNKLF